MRGGLRSACVPASVALALWAPCWEAHADPLSIAVGDKAKRSVELSRASGGGLRGRLTIVVGNTGKPATVAARYFPSRGRAVTPAAGARVAYAVKPPTVGNGNVAALSLVFTLPAKERPVDLDGSLAIELRRNGKRVGPPVVLDVSGTGDALAGVAVQPDKLSLQVNDLEGPLGNPDSTDGTVELRGPGVPGLFRSGFLPPSPSVVLRDGHGHEITARVTELTQTESPTVAKATITAEGDLVPGSYKGDVPFSDLSATAPKLSLTVNARDAFPWALLFVVLGAVAGGLLYLASNLSRRKRLMQAYVKATLDEYKQKLQQHPPVWDLQLGDSANWFRVKWSAMPERDGVQGTWSTIHWARNDSDLELAAVPARALIDRISRWFSAIEPVQELAKVADWKPENADKVWTDSKTWADTDLLRRCVEADEPKDEATAQKLLDRMHRQVRWHAALARVWHIRTKVFRWVSTHGTDDQKRLLETIDLTKVDADASPEGERTPDGQLALEQKIEKMEQQLRLLYGGDVRDLEPDDTSMAVAIGKLTAIQANALPAPEIKLPVAATPANTPRAISSITVQDWLWTAAVVLVTCAVYVPTLYGPDWGSLGDYASAFAAGFVGNVVINWAVLPAFQSMSPWKAPVSPHAAGDSPADGAKKALPVATGGGG